MRRILAGLALCGALVAAGCDSQPKSPFNGIDVTGSPLGHDLALNDFNGKPRTLADFRGKVTIVAIGGSWCPNCHDETPFLVSLYKKYHEQGLEIVVLSFEEADQLSDPEFAHTSVAVAVND